jgi:hypothetical protein
MISGCSWDVAVGVVSLTELRSALAGHESKLLGEGVLVTVLRPRHLLYDGRGHRAPRNVVLLLRWRTEAEDAVAHLAPELARRGRRFGVGGSRA